MRPGIASLSSLPRVSSHLGPTRTSFSRVRPALQTRARVQNSTPGLRSFTLSHRACRDAPVPREDYGNSNARPAETLNHAVTEEEKVDFEKKLEENKDKQIRTPWHREGSSEPPVNKQRQASAMTKGKLLTTPSRMLKLILPLTTQDVNSDRKDIEPLALLVHPQQPLSYLERLIQAELPTITKDGKERIPAVYFRAEDSMQDEIQPSKPEKTPVQDADGSEHELGEHDKNDTLRSRDAEDAAQKRDEEHNSQIRDEKKASRNRDEDHDSKNRDEEHELEKADETMIDGKPARTGKITGPMNRRTPEEAAELRGKHGEGGVESYSGLGKDAPADKHSERKFVRWSSSTEIGDFIRDAARGQEFAVEIEGAPNDIRVGVPSFSDRTYYLRMRLRTTSKKISSMAEVKKECDHLAHKGAQRVAMGGFGILCGWWYAVYRLTFETELGWDVMEPVTYLVGLSTLIGGYIWFLYHNREVSYRSAMNFTISRRQSKLYNARGFDLRTWEGLIEEANALRREIKAVANEYDVEWDELEDEKDEKVMEALKKDREKKKGGKKKDDDDEGPKLS